MRCCTDVIRPGVQLQHEAKPHVASRPRWPATPVALSPVPTRPGERDPRGSAAIEARRRRERPAPSSSGTFPGAQQLGVSNSQYQAAERACRHLLPNSQFAMSLNQCLMTGNCPPALVRRALIEGLKFAQCMRNHGGRTGPTPLSIPRGVTPPPRRRRARIGRVLSRLAQVRRLRVARRPPPLRPRSSRKPSHS